MDSPEILPRASLASCPLSPATSCAIFRRPCARPRSKKMVREFITESDDATIALGRSLAAEVTPPLVILLHGDMGAGKTTFSKGLISGLGVAREEEITSPTFTLVHQYKSVFHV